jgi:hypothetical protein
MKLPKTLILVFFCIILSSITKAQFTFERYPNGTNKIIIFSNGTKCDLSSSNPFLLDRPADDQSNSEHIYRNVSISEIKTAKDPSLFIWRKDKIPDDETLVAFYTFHNTSFEDGFIVVSYLLLVYNNYDALIGNTSKIIVFDSLGNINFEKQFNKDCLSVNITSDGKTLSFYVGGQHDESLGTLNRTCATFYNIPDDSTVLKLYAEDSTYISSMGGYDNILFVKMTNGYKKENKMYFFISNTKTLYSIILTYEQYRRIHKFSNQGIILSKFPNDKTVSEKLLFTRDFKKEVML